MSEIKQLTMDDLVLEIRRAAILDAEELISDAKVVLKNSKVKVTSEVLAVTMQALTEFRRIITNDYLQHSANVECSKSTVKSAKLSVSEE